MLAGIPTQTHVVVLGGAGWRHHTQTCGRAMWYWLASPHTHTCGRASWCRLASPQIRFWLCWVVVSGVTTHTHVVVLGGAVWHHLTHTCGRARSCWLAAPHTHTHVVVLGGAGWHHPTHACGIAWWCWLVSPHIHMRSC